jgi:hypothetical protein
MKLSSALLVCVGLIAVSNFAEAARRPLLQDANSRLSGQGYGMAGCGLGSMLIGPKPGASQIFAAITNGTFGSQTFGISTGTSNCTDGGMVADAHVVPAYVEANRQALSTEIARGEGETLSGLAQVMACNDPAALATSLKSNYGTIFPSASATDQNVTSAMINVVKSNPALRCGNVI